MTRTASLEEGAGPASAAHLLATWPAGRGERRFALIVVLVTLAFFAVIAPFAKQPLAQVWAFIPIYQSALVFNDVITALLLFGQFRIARSKAVLVLASGYLFTAFATIAHGLSFPGLFAAGGLLGAGPQSTAWLYMFWHGGFPLFVSAYALLRGTRHEMLPPALPIGRVVAGVAGGVVLGVAAFTVFATAGHEFLPAIMQGNRYTPAMLGVVTAVWLSSLTALVLLWRRRCN